MKILINKRIKIITLLLGLSCFAFSQDYPKEDIIIESYEDCKCFQDSIFGGKKSIHNFEQLVLGLNKDSILNMNFIEKDSLLKSLFAKTNNEQRYLSPDGTLRNYPKFPICKLYCSYIDRIEQQDQFLERFISMAQDSTLQNSKSLSLTIVEFCYFTKRKITKLYEGKMGKGYYERTEGDLFLTDKKTESGIVKNWDNIKKIIIEEMLNEMKYFYYQYDLAKLTTDGCTDMVVVSYQNDTHFFYYPDLDLEPKCELAPGKTILTLKNLINKSVK